MRSLTDIEALIAAAGDRSGCETAAADLIRLGEEVLEHWIVARGECPTREHREGFRLLALQRQGARGEPSFNACRETCRELAFHYNLIAGQPEDGHTAQHLRMMAMLTMHLHLFVCGKLEVDGLGDFCCSSRPLHAARS